MIYRIPVFSFLILILSITMCCELFAQSVRVIYFYGADQPAPDQSKINEVARIARKSQSFYREQMIKNGFGDKTFNLEGGNNTTIYTLKGTRLTAHYAANRWEQVIEEVSRTRLDINLVLIEGLNVLSDASGAVMQRRCSGNACRANHFTYWAVIPMKTDGVIPASAHELGHAFGLQHNLDNESLMIGVRWIPTEKHPPIDDMYLLDYEARWLDKHKYFNNDTSLNDPPTIHKIYDTEWIDGHRIEVRFRVDVESNYALHQAKLVSLADGVVANDALMGLSDNAYFHISKYKLNNKAMFSLQIIDSQGNMRYLDRINIDKPNIENTQSIVEAKPATTHSSVVIGWAELKQ